jgi:hypothetical protein
VQIGQDPDGTLRISHQAYTEDLSNINANLHKYISSVRTARGKVSWIASWTHLDAAFAKGRLIFCKMDFKSLHVVFYSDASFAGNMDLSSQIGGLIRLKDKHGDAHVLLWFSKKCPRVTGSVLAAEIIDFVTAFDMASALRNIIEEIYQQPIPLHGLTDSYFFFPRSRNTMRCEGSVYRSRSLLYARPTQISSLPI